MMTIISPTQVLIIDAGSPPPIAICFVVEYFRREEKRGRGGGRDLN